MRSSAMQIEIFTLCDAATDSFGKLNVLGAFDTLASASEPVAHPQCAFAIRLRIQKIESGEHSLALHLVDENGSPIGPAPEGKFQIQIPPEETSVAVNMIFNLQNLQLPRWGAYSANLMIDGSIRASLPLFVKRAQVPGAGIFPHG